MARAYDKPHALGRLAAYMKGEATWHLLTWNKQARLLDPLSRHYAVSVVDTAGDEIERIEVTAHTYRALRRMLVESDALLPLVHTPGIGYENKEQLIALKQRARNLLQQAEQDREMLEEAVSFVQKTPGISLLLADEFVGGATKALVALKVLDTAQEQIQQLGPPLFQVALEDVASTIEQLGLVVAQAEAFIKGVEVPQPRPATRFDVGEPTPESMSPSNPWEHQVRVPIGMRFPDVPLQKRLKAMNAAYFRLLEGFHLLLRDTIWEKGLHERLERLDLEQVSRGAFDFTRTEVMYLRFLSRYHDDPKTIDDEFLERIQQFLPVRYLKQELLSYLAQL
jgi:hypothetical protein